MRNVGCWDFPSAPRTFYFFFFSQYCVIVCVFVCVCVCLCLCVCVFVCVCECGLVGKREREREREGRGITVAENLLLDEEWTMRLRRHIREQGGSFCATGSLCRMRDLRCPLLPDTGRAWENVMLTRNIINQHLIVLVFLFYFVM